VGADFEWFKKYVYQHTASMPEHRALLGEAQDGPIRMGNFSPDRLPEPVLEEIWRYVSQDLGLRAPVTARLTPGAAAGGAVTHSVTVTNGGLPGKGLSAEELSVAIRLPAGASVATATGVGYQGVRRSAEAGADVAVWNVPRLAPKDNQTFTITLTGSGSSEGVAGRVLWTRTGQGKGGADSVNIAVPQGS
jgi:hypothetical protein